MESDKATNSCSLVPKSPFFIYSQRSCHRHLIQRFIVSSCQRFYHIPALFFRSSSNIAPVCRFLCQPSGSLILFPPLPLLFPTAHYAVRCNLCEAGLLSIPLTHPLDSQNCTAECKPSSARGGRELKGGRWSRLGRAMGLFGTHSKPMIPSVDTYLHITPPVHRSSSLSVVNSSESKQVF